MGRQRVPERGLLVLFLAECSVPRGTGLRMLEGPDRRKEVKHRGRDRVCFGGEGGGRRARRRNSRTSTERGGGHTASLAKP